MRDGDRHLEQEIAMARRRISSDSYPMSIGELTNLYRDGELVITPAFQRLFRWDDEQKSRLIESILLGIPLPSIFVSQREDGKWELVDGLQRVSTILQLQGLLKKDGQPVPALQLQGTKYLPALAGMYWEHTSEPSLTSAQRLDVKRSKLDIKIIKRESSETTKYDLFQRLNSYGSPLTAQELRSAILVSVNSRFYTWLEQLASTPAFTDTTALSDRLLAEQYNIELALRFLILHNRSRISRNDLRNFSQLLDDAGVTLAERYPHGAEDFEAVFTQTFSVLYETARDNSFKKWDAARGEFTGGFLNTAYEVIAMGLGYCIANRLPYRKDIEAAAKELWQRQDMTTRFATGLATEARLARMLPMGRELMAAR